jgi:orotate phosphoribosyltransferase
MVVMRDIVGRDLRCANDKVDCDAVHDEPLLSLITARDGHFVYESGHHGELWLELDALFTRPRALRPFVVELARRLAPYETDVICGPMVGGAFLAQLIAEEMGVEFVHALRFTAERDTNTLYPVSYQIPQALRGRIAGRTVAVVDDVINAGSAVRATVADVLACDARPVVIAALLVLGSSPATFAAESGIGLEALARRDNHLWPPSDCPLCARGIPLEGLSP